MYICICNMQVYSWRKGYRKDMHVYSCKLVGMKPRFGSVKSDTSQETSSWNQLHCFVHSWRHPLSDVITGHAFVPRPNEYRFVHFPLLTQIGWNWKREKTNNTLSPKSWLFGCCRCNIVCGSYKNKLWHTSINRERESACVCVENRRETLQIERTARI